MAYTGIYERTIFYNPVNKYSVISVKTSDRSIPEKARSAYRHRDNMIHFAAVGYELPRTDQVSMILDGEWKEGKNGVQLHVTQCEEVVPQTREGIKGYLSSRLIKGIGGKTAELIVDRFGADTLNVLENEPERLLEIRGVSKAKLEEIIASYNESRALRDLMLLLAPFQITPTTATKIYDHFGARSVDILRDNPFELCQVSGFGFKRVDAIMRKNNWPLNSPMRIRGAVFAALESAKGDGGHLYLEAEQLHKEAMSLLNSMIPVPQMRVKSDDLDAVIDDMLLLANSDADTLTIKPEACQPDLLLLDTYEKFEPLAKKNGLHLILTLPEEILPDCFCDIHRTEQIFSIIVDNALCYTPSGGKVTLSCHAENEMLCFLFEDTGCGILEEKKSHIFERFYRADDAHTDREHFGLGLCIAKELTEKQNGNIQVVDAPISGSCFMVQLPCAL